MTGWFAVQLRRGHRDKQLHGLKKNKKKSVCDRAAGGPRGSKHLRLERQREEVSEASLLTR